MDLKSNHTAPVLTDHVPISKPRLEVYSSLFPYSPSGAAFSPGSFLTMPRKKTGIIEDFRSSSWLDSMKSSSPPHMKMAKDINQDIISTDSDIAYSTWMVLLIAACAIF